MNEFDNDNQLKISEPTTGFGIGLGAFLTSFIPFLGFIGIAGVIFGLRYLAGPNRSRGGSAVAAIFFGLLAMGVAGFWTHIIGKGSCPHVYSFDGSEWRLDADPLSGSLYAGAAREDLDRLEMLRPSNGQYRIRVIGELQEIDYIDELSLLVTDHETNSIVLPTSDGALLQLRDAVPPLRATDSAGRDVLPQLRSADGQSVTGELLTATSAFGKDPREHLSLHFARPRSNSVALLLTAHNTPFAEEAYIRYMASIGPGIGALLRLSQTDSDYPYPQRLADESRRLGLPLIVRVDDGGGIALGPIGPAIQRDFAVPITLTRAAEPADTLNVRLDLTPQFWEIDQVRLAESPIPIAAQRLRPRVVRDKQGQDVGALVAAADQKSAVLHLHDYIEAAFDVPPLPPNAQRTVVLSIRGHYENEFGGRGLLNPLALAAHHLGLRSLPRYAKGLKSAR